MVMGLVWVALMVAGLWMVFTAWGRAEPRFSGRSNDPPGPLEILRQRYARGEIDSREYDERRQKLLESTRSGSGSADQGHVTG